MIYIYLYLTVGVWYTHTHTMEYHFAMNGNKLANAGDDMDIFQNNNAKEAKPEVR